MRFFIVALITSFAALAMASPLPDDSQALTTNITPDCDLWECLQDTGLLQGCIDTNGQSPAEDSAAPGSAACIYNALNGASNVAGSCNGCKASQDAVQTAINSLGGNLYSVLTTEYGN